MEIIHGMIPYPAAPGIFGIPFLFVVCMAVLLSGFQKLLGDGIINIQNDDPSVLFSL